MTTLLTAFGYLTIAPLIPLPLLLTLALPAVILAAIGLVKRATGAFWRLGALMLLVLALLNPAYVAEERQKTDDIALLVVDRSPSQRIGTRAAQTDALVAALTKKIEALPHLRLRVIETGRAGDTETKLMQPALQALAEIPEDRRAGVLLITDGQVHDALSGKDLEALSAKTPFHVLLTGKHHETDRRLKVLSAPSFSLTGQTVSAKILIEDTPTTSASNTTLTLTGETGEPQMLNVPIGRPFDLPLDITHAGPNILGLEVAPLTGELSLSNNRAALMVGGVQERLRVMMISSTPHNGERTWRNTLKSDPNVDLVHFTILRDKNTVDPASESEMSLIPFPIDELFNVKLHDFDLVIIDRYNDPTLISPLYLSKLTNFVKNGGALLDASGTDLNQTGGLAKTVVAQLLPSVPLPGGVLSGTFTPEVTKEVGLRHPVTQDLATADKPLWGPWYRQAQVSPSSQASILMTGLNGAPLLLLSEEGKGRVAQLTSEQLWLWTRGHKGGGPSETLIRNLIHWLLKEPDLEAERLSAKVDGQTLTVTRHSQKPDSSDMVTLTAPDGSTQTLTLSDNGKVETTSLQLSAPGLYRLTDSTHVAFAVLGDPNALEQADLRATPDIMRPVVEKTGGGIIWAEDAPDAPHLKRVSTTAKAGSDSWLGLRDNGAYTVSGLTHTPLLPALLATLTCLAALLFAWYKEGR